MNTRDDWLTTATIHDEARRNLWSVVFPGAIVPIKSMLTCKVNVPGHDNADAYMLDLDAISDDQIERLCNVISVAFGIPLDEVRSEINMGVPILAEGVSVATRDQGLFFSMLDDNVRQ
jgi:hypothetical protein